MLQHFWDEAEGGFFTTSDDHEQLINRPKDLFDNAVPSGNSMAVEVLLRLSALSGEGRYAERAEQTLTRPLRRAAPRAGRLRAPARGAGVLCSPRRPRSPSPARRTAPIRGALLGVVDGAYRPNVVTALARPGAVEAGVALLDGREPVEGHAAAYVCRHFACRRPVTTPDELAAELTMPVSP